MDLDLGIAPALDISGDVARFHKLLIGRKEDRGPGNILIELLVLMQMAQPGHLILGAFVRFQKFAEARSFDGNHAADFSSRRHNALDLGDGEGEVRTGGDGKPAFVATRPVRLGLPRPAPNHHRPAFRTDGDPHINGPVRPLKDASKHTAE